MIIEMVLQSVISKVFSTFVSKVVNDSENVLKSAIKEADLNRKSYNQDLQTQMYRVIVDALNVYTYNKYKKQDKLYDAAESILIGFMSSKDDADVIKSGLEILTSGVDDDACKRFLRFYALKFVKTKMMICIKKLIYFGKSRKESMPIENLKRNIKMIEKCLKK